MNCTHLDTVADAKLDAGTILDFDCGTGQLAAALATGGRGIIGVDPAKAMVDLARTREGAEIVEWIWGDVGDVIASNVDLVVMTGNIPSTQTGDEEYVHGDWTGGPLTTSSPDIVVVARKRT